MCEREIDWRSHNRPQFILVNHIYLMSTQLNIIFIKIFLLPIVLCVFCRMEVLSCMAWHGTAQFNVKHTHTYKKVRREKNPAQIRNKSLPTLNISKSS